ncbi:MAG TPA: trypsin-like peptidase domain-containing protein [Verrucomicrobiae bacterium]
MAGRIAASALAWSLLAAAQAEPDVRRDAIVKVTEEVMPCVVNIRTESVVQASDPYEAIWRSFYGRPKVESSLGSGVIISKDGYLLTNLHVVKRATRIQVKLSDAAGGGVYDVEPMYGTSQIDVAMLKIIPHKKGEQFKAISFAQDDDLLLGETVLALGNPFGLGESVTKGILSSKRRAAPKENQDLQMENWLQTDAQINPGNSGGPLVDLRGNLIGINNAILEGAQGIGFAIPIKEVRHALGEIFNAETAGRWFGAQISVNEPLTVLNIERNSPALDAGLKTGDVIEELNGHPAGDYIDLTRILRAQEDMHFDLTVRRDGEPRRIDLRLQAFTELFHRRMGLDLQELTPSLARQMGLENLGGEEVGLVISHVDKGGPADRASLKEYDVLEAIGNRRVGNFLDVHAALASLAEGGTAELSVLVPRTRGNLILGYRAGETALRFR